VDLLERCIFYVSLRLSALGVFLSDHGTIGRGVCVAGACMCLRSMVRRFLPRFRISRGPGAIYKAGAFS